MTEEIKPPTVLDKSISFIETVTPKWLKVSVALFIIAWNTPIKVRDWFYDSVDTRAYAVVHTVIDPMKIQRDSQISDIHTRLNALDVTSKETNAFVRALALEELGAKRYQQVELTSVDKGK